MPLLTMANAGKPARMRGWHPRAPALRDNRDWEGSPTGGCIETRRSLLPNTSKYETLPLNFPQTLLSHKSEIMSTSSFLLP